MEENQQPSNTNNFDPTQLSQLNEIGQLPFNMEYKWDMMDRVRQQFNYLNKNSYMIADYLQNILDNYHHENSYTIDQSTFTETITFHQLGGVKITVPLEKVNLNANHGEIYLLEAILKDLASVFGNRTALPYDINNFQHIELQQNNHFEIKLKGVPYAGLETFALMLILDRIFQIKPLLRDEYKDMFEEVKHDGIRYKQLYEDDVWLTYPELIDENTITYKFIVLTFDVREQLAPYLEVNDQQQSNHQLDAQATQQVEELAWYGSKRYDIVDRVLALQSEKDRLAQRSAVQEAALRAQQPFLQQSMKDIGNSGTFTGPPKYLNQRDAPLEIPIEVIKNLFTVMDQDMDERISIDELSVYSKKKYLPFDDDTIVEMFKEASSGRGIVHEKQREAPLTLEEIAAAVRGRHKWNSQARQWDVSYRPCRDYWIILLKTVNERLFAIPLPKVVPQKILAQFEEEDLKQTIRIEKKEGLDKKYLSIKEQKELQFQKDKFKLEGGIQPDLQTGTLKFTDKKQKKVDQNPYEQQINARLQQSESVPNNYPKVTFESKEFYNQSKILSSVIPHWKNEKENPIYQYVPTTERPFTNDSDALFNTQLQQKIMTQSMREQRLHELQQKERTLQLAGTMALKNRKTSPWKVMKERQGFVTKFKVPTILDQKTDAAFVGKNAFDERGRCQGPVQDPYNPPSDHKFRDLEINRGQKDFELRYKCPDPYNKYNMSEHDTRPKEVIERHRRNEEQEKQMRKLEYESILKGQPLEKKKAWLLYHSLPDKLTPVSHDFKDKHSKAQKEKNPFLDKEEFTPAYLQLARQLKDDVVFGKPNFNLYYKTMKPSDLNEEFGGTKTKPYKCIY
eukprot:403372486